MEVNAGTKVSVSIIATVALLIIGCASAAKKDTRPRFSLMAYNVENLFDWKDDQKTLDETYLPKDMKLDARVQERCKQMTTERYKEDCLTLDWSEKVVHLKMGRLAAVIKKDDKLGPDIIVMPEVENLFILKLFRDKYLADLGYQTVVHIDGEDERGIDVGLLSKFPLAGSPKLHAVDISQLDFVDRDGKISGKGKPTRGILEVPLLLPNGDKVTVFGVHFPSPAGPRSFREKALEVLDKVTKEKRDKEYVIVAGDFNITDEEDNVAGLYSEVLKKDWGVSHLLGCKSCKGTHVFKDRWSYLDAIIVSKPFLEKKDSGWTADKNSIRTVTNSVYQVGRFKGSPKFDSGRSTGVSDHYPMIMEFVLNEPKAVTTKSAESKEGEDKAEAKTEVKKKE